MGGGSYACFKIEIALALILLVPQRFMCQDLDLHSTAMRRGVEW